MSLDSSPNEGHRQRLRERFVRGGLDGFADYEVVELLLTLAIPRRDVKRQAKALIKTFGTLRGILDAPAEQLQQIDGIGTVAPTALRIIKEAASLYLQQTSEEREFVGHSESGSRFWRSRIGALSNEVLEVGYLDSSLRLQRNGVERMEEGTTDRATVYPRTVIEAALKRKATALVFAHNHPNGDVRPTEQDKVLTRALVLAATTVGIKVHDHLIVSADEVFSFRKEGLL
jgi:DNA repair protein RadC